MNDRKKCTRCKVNLPLNKFAVKRSGDLAKQCLDCSKKQAENRRKNKCEHGKQRHQCKECGGSSICEHGKRRNQCKECGGSSICEHNRRKQICQDCGGASICSHKKDRSRCVVCSPLGNLRRRIFTRFYHHFAQRDYTPEQDYLFYLGCTVPELYEKLKDKIHSIDNYSIDHIKPLSKFDLTNEEQIKRCFHHSNVQVIPLLDNIRKFNKWTEEDEKQWSESIQT